MTTRSWFGKQLASRKPRASRRVPYRARPVVEALEDRLAPANPQVVLTNFQIPTGGAEGSPVLLSATATDSGGFPLTYIWTITNPDGTTTAVRNKTQSGDLATFTPLDDGTYGVSLTVSDGDGGSDVMSASFPVANVAPTITAFTVPTTGTEGSPIAVSATATDPAGDNDPLTYTWTVTRPDGTTLTTLDGASASFTPPDNVSYGVKLTVSDGDGGSDFRTATVAVADVAPTPAISGVTTALATQVLTYTLTATDPSSVDRAAGFTYNVNWGDGSSQGLARTANNGTGLKVTHNFAPSSKVSSVTVTNGGRGYTTAPTVTFSASPSGTTATGTATIVGGVVTGVTITNPGSGYTAAPTVTFSAPPSGTTATGTARLVTATVVGHSPALDVTDGNVVLEDMTLLTDTNSPTVVVSGGALTLRNVAIVESSGGSQAAVEIDGGSVDLGTQDDPGGNVFNARGQGELIHNAGANGVSAVGNSFQADDVEITSPYRIKDRIFDALNAGGGGLVTYVPGSAFITVNGGSIQRGIDAIAEGGTVHVEAGSYKQYDAGSKLVTIAFEGGPTLSQQPNPQDPSLHDIVVTGTAGADQVLFNPGGGFQVLVNNLPNGRFNPTGRVVASGLGGDDDIHVVGGITLPAFLYGGDGNDRLEGGGGSNVLVGGGGDDALIGGKGPNLLIGGTGADTLTGGPGDNLLIGGTTAFDANDAALSAILAEWASGRSYAARVANLSGTGSGPRSNGNYFLMASGPSATVLDDAAVDVLNGDSGMDWFFASLAQDVLHGRYDGEIVEGL